MRFFLTLFHNKHKFIGRTYSSIGDTIESKAGVYFCNLDEYVVFHTKFPIKDLKFVIEFAVNEKFPNLSKLESCGWCRFEFGNGALHSELCLGSPQFLTVPSYKRNIMFDVYSYFKKRTNDSL